MKNEKNADVEAVAYYYNLRYNEAKKYMPLINEETLEKIKKAKGEKDGKK
jgi:hypothetical protein